MNNTNTINTVVYCVIGSQKNYYVEQFVISLWSLKHYNPTLSVKIISDESTISFLHSTYPSIQNQISEEIIIDFPSDKGAAYRSRFIKTNLLSILKSNFLFLDTDTLIIRNLDEVLEFNQDIGAVPDLHQPSLLTCRYLNWLQKQTKKIGWPQFDSNVTYYNSGILLVRNTEKANQFFNSWHKNWLFSQSKGVYQDQLSMNYTNIEMPYISHLSPYLHCQILGNGLKFLMNAYIIHYFNSSSADNKNIKPFFLLENGILQEVRDHRDVTDNIKDRVINHDFFPDRLDLISGENIDIFNSALYKAIASIYHKFPMVYKNIERLLNIIFRR